MRNQLHLGLEEDAWRLSDSAKEVIFQLRNGHCQLLAHLYKLGLFPTDECPCSTDIQTLEHLLQFCLTFSVMRSQTWPSAGEFSEKFWGLVAAHGLTLDIVLKTSVRM